MIERVFLGEHETVAAAVRRWLADAGRESTWIVVETKSTAVRWTRFGRFSADWLRVIDAEEAAEALLPSMASVDPLLRRQALWSALESIPDAQRIKSFPSSEGDARIGWDFALDALDELFSELNHAGFCAEDVRLLSGDLPPTEDRDRWRVLAEIERGVLERIGAVVPAPQSPPPRLVLAALGELPGRLRRWIDRNREAVEIVALIAANESDGERFDDAGTVRPGAWLTAKLPIEREQMTVASSASQQAAAAFEFVEKFRPIGCVALASFDEALTPFLDAEGCRRGVCKPPGARRLGRTAPFRLLAAAAEFLEADAFAAFSSLVRHPDFEAALERTIIPGHEGFIVSEVLADLDDLAAQRLSDGVARFWNAAWDESARTAEKRVATLLRSARRTLEGLTGDEAPVASWVAPIRAFLERVYGPSLDWTSEALQQLKRGLDEAASWKNERAPTVAGWEALRWLATRFANAAVERRDDEGDVQRFDWPDVVWSEAEAVVLVGFNEGRLPTSRRAEAFLPNQLRERMRNAAGDGRRIADNDLRYAVDAYRLCAALQGRKQTMLAAGRLGAVGEPLLPSRFWFARPAGELPERVQQFFDAKRQWRPPPSSDSVLSNVNDLAFQLPPKLEFSPPAIRSLRVTAFRDYIACPYRFYLRHILGLQQLRTSRGEMDGAQFGSLAHDVLMVLDHPELKEETDPGRIFHRISSVLDEKARAVFGDEPTPAVQIQIEQLRARFQTFAERHAEEIANGWRVEVVETPIPAGALDVDGEPFTITGRIDRIDVNVKTGSWRILDYKTGDAAKPPEQTHRRKGEWVDLQLPLYWHLTEKPRIDAYAGVGYVLLSKDLSAIKTELAPWNREDLEGAVGKAKDVVRRIRRGEYWPPATPAPDGFPEFAGLCRDGLRLPLAEEP